MRSKSANFLSFLYINNITHSLTRPTPSVHHLFTIFLARLIGPCLLSNITQRSRPVLESSCKRPKKTLIGGFRRRPYGLATIPIITSRRNFVVLAGTRRAEEVFADALIRSPSGLSQAFFKFSSFVLTTSLLSHYGESELPVL